MKLGIFSDVHGNIEALEAVVRMLRDSGATQFVCCGDIVGYGPDPNSCVETIRRMHCTGVAGNHDYGVVGKTPLDSFNSSATQALLWTRNLLTESNRLYLENLYLAADDGPLLVVHSSPSVPDAWEYVVTLREAEDEMEYYPDGICVVGHSHQPLAVERTAGGQARLVRQDSFKLRPDAKYFINAGSVGQPRDGDPRACGLLYDTGAQTITRYRVPYDIAAVQAKIRAACLPESLASRLELGR
ncbi:MAG: metallophosphoesterase family protein [candidate division WOR-3 bacterium]|nr:metallophosphoesterase family protein [candidate division WOR-3 bacterium]